MDLMSSLLKHLFNLLWRARRAWRRALRIRPQPPPLLRAGAGQAPLPFIEGVNLPWLSYGGDFGANAWSPDGGLSRPGRTEELHRQLRELRERGSNVVRWFLFCDGRAGIRFTPAGTPLGPDDRLFADIDAALATLAAERMKVIFVLLDFLWFDEPAWVNSVQTGGRTRVVSGTYKQQRFRRRVLRPLLERCGRSQEILAWDIVNEPEWATRGWGGGIIGPSVPYLRMRRFIKRAARLVHRHTGHLATVGLANAAGLPLVRGCGLDLYQVHWYERWQDAAPLERPIRELDADRPVLLGEYPTRGASRPPQAIRETARHAGYCGALAWSWNGQDEFSGMKKS
jgi:hypothetical protein